MNVEITTQPQLRAAGIRHVGPYTQISEAFARLGAVAGKAGLFGANALMIGLYHDDPRTTPERELRSDAAVTVSPSMKIPAGLTELVVPRGRYARTTHFGSYETIGDTWSRLMEEWFPQNGHRIGDGVSYEIYRNDPTNAKPEDLITDIYIPVG